MNITPWNDPAVLVQAVAVLVAAIAAFAVIWQAILTRRALADAASSLRIAEESLAIAREAQAHAALLSVEAVKARIALNAPQADLAVDRDEASLLSISTTPSGHPQPWPSGHVFHVNDSSLPIMVRVPVSLRNTGARATRFTLYEQLREPNWSHNSVGGAVLVDTSPGPFERLLAPGESVDGYWEVTRTLGEWIAIYDARQLGDPDTDLEFAVYVDDGQDTGAGYSFRVLMGGTPVKPSDQGLRETWVLSESDHRTGEGIGFGRLPARITYWLSKANNIPLRDVATDLVGIVD